MQARRPEWADDCCVICPAQKHGFGEFDVVDRTQVRYAFDAEVGCRIDQVTQVPVCVHPFRVGLAPGLYASAGHPLAEQRGPDPDEPPRPVVERPPVFTPSPEQLVLPESVDDLEGWLIAMLRTAAHHEMASALNQAEAIAGERFTGEQIVQALRRVLAVELARPR
ncbi:hypothetical protein E1287_07595 [Actinomadura sp. KC06]|uniref:hypothetical protein n=1 Tax=Actinomadura sp. KC06 TaxID=2530369 RepID=UPI00104A0C12|nr:hypothetical protein [Actinomadura sp. KC06]TDD37912.1 hypothetical protein E1287_07595 [Actinomadura sp. KC06]